MQHPENFDCVLIPAVDNEERRSRNDQLPRAQNYTGPPGIWKVSEVASGIMEAAAEPLRRGRVILGNEIELRLN